jgi:hypothetical protein
MKTTMFTVLTLLMLQSTLQAAPSKILAYKTVEGLDGEERKHTT